MSTHSVCFLGEIRQIFVKILSLYRAPTAQTGFNTCMKFTCAVSHYSTGYLDVRKIPGWQSLAFGTFTATLLLYFQQRCTARALYGMPFWLSLGSIKSTIWQVQWLDLVGINQYAKIYQNIPHGSGVMAIFIFSLFCLDLASVKENSHLVSSLARACRYLLY